MQDAKQEVPAPQAYWYTLRMPGLRSDKVMRLFATIFLRMKRGSQPRFITSHA
jgi:hypothetical protein